jgi:hypothetical protein
LIQCERPATGIEFTLQGTAGKLETFSGRVSSKVE